MVLFIMTLKDKYKFKKPKNIRTEFYYNISEEKRKNYIGKVFCTTNKRGYER